MSNLQKLLLISVVILFVACLQSEQRAVRLTSSPSGSSIGELIDRASSSSSRESDKANQYSKDLWSDEALFEDLRENHWIQIFPDGGRNAGGPQFFKYIYENLASSHALFQRYNEFYCGVSGSVVGPGGAERYDRVKVKDSKGQCVVGEYRRCCWPCSCDVMKHARAEQVDITLPKDPSQHVESYWVLTIGDPCHSCEDDSCASIPEEVTAYRCKDGATENGLRVFEGQLTTKPNGRLVFAMLHNVRPAEYSPQSVSEELLEACKPRIDATPTELREMGGMGNIFVDLALINNEELFTNSSADLCK